MGWIGCPETSLATNLRYVKSHNRAYLIYNAAETSNHSQIAVLNVNLQLYICIFMYVFKKERRRCKPSCHSSFEHEPHMVRTSGSSISLCVPYQPFRQRTCKRKLPNHVLSVGNAPPAQVWTWKSDLVP
jgi:hypothetical protein